MSNLFNTKKHFLKTLFICLFLILSIAKLPFLATDVQATDILSTDFTRNNYLSTKLTLIASYRDLIDQKRNELEELRKKYQLTTPNQTNTPKPSIKPTNTPQPTNTPVPSATATAQPTSSPTPIPSQGSKYYTNQQLFDALNVYRAKQGKPALAWSQKLADFAKTRTDTFVKLGKLDNHAGFNNYIHNQNGFAQLGFRKLGENSSFGYTFSATNLIEQAYGQSPGHNSNQLGSWSHIGISANGTFTDFVFAGN